MIQKQSEKYGPLKSHHSLMPYYADVYNTLMSIVQGIALAALTYVLNRVFYEEPSRFSPDIYFYGKVLIAFSIVCLIWHKYVTFNQFLLWPIRYRDAAIPMLFAISQNSMMFAILQDHHIFYWHVTVICFIGALAYLFAIRELKDVNHKKCLEHLDTSVKKSLYRNVMGYCLVSSKILLVFSLIFLAIYIVASHVDFIAYSEILFGLFIVLYGMEASLLIILNRKFREHLLGMSANAPNRS